MAELNYTQLEQDLIDILNRLVANIDEVRKRENQTDFNKGIDIYADYKDAVKQILNRTASLDIYEALKNLPEPKSILSECAYTGGDVPKKWVNERSIYIKGYNQALEEVKAKTEKALAKAEGQKGENNG